MRNHKLSRPQDITREPDTFEVALFAYFGMSNKAIMRHMRHMNPGKIQYRLKKARDHYRIAVKRSDYRDGNNQLSRRVIGEFSGFARRQITMGNLK